LYKSLLHKSEFGQTHYEEWFKRSPTKFILKFLGTPTNFYEFWKFETNFGIIYLKQKKKKDSRRAEFCPRLQCSARRPATRGRLKQPRGRGLAARPSGENGLRGSRQRARRPRVERRSGTFIGGGWTTVRSCRGSQGGHRGGAAQGGEGRGTPERCAVGE
jgi:hypothetical protein